MPSASLPEALRAAERWLLPGACLECGGGVGPADPLFCPACQGRWRALPEPQCGRCGQPAALLASGCRICAVWPEGLGRARSAVWLDDAARSAVHALKYDGWRRVAPLLARRMAPLLPRQGGGTLVPIPLAAARERRRGYNQAGVLAGALAAIVGLPVVADWLRRARDTRTQTALTPEARRANMAGAFRAAGLPRGARVVLVDDVFTTGATLAEAAVSLLEAGAGAVEAVTFARARPPLG
ncbi:MAG: ComF family protein [Gemmatimonadota bacterium]|nr:ComF family protein [Gemmatimonadota bacterium]